MTLTELRYVVAVARERHFGRAAERCFVSQPTLSVAVRKLEDELGLTLFERGRSEVVATPAGERIVSQAQRVLEEAEAIRRIAQEGRDQLSEPLRLGAVHTVGPYLLPHLVPELHRRAPAMPLVVDENHSSVLAERLRHGELDAIIVALPFTQAGVCVRALYAEPFVALLPAAHPWSAERTIALSRLEQERVLLPGLDNGFRAQVLEVCPGCRRGGDLDRALEGSSLETIRHMVASGMGVSVLPCTASAVRYPGASLLATRPFDPPAPRRTVVLAWRRSFPRPAAVEALAEAVAACGLECVEPLPP